ncbi:SDR family oxidoreductase (plasmid) [Haloferax mediterranei ATCC 33500]|uniref:Oxidoreductase n=1 Tax=Haloferax mediterranei (strain ATCC 33500 / DSM 1411 / JCM 8866 / NBRC 14739 / NCIMB 2177 / R-4) TaxID=523841 RepID=I3R9K5_HALMT|nr:SDR family oxidoreductase [Haloferax mediterranei]AFK20915.1 short-chain dehydrogenase/reductase SDR [Haloferax mediterranei ATCC 33500]AHZ24216.1 oxidoreductase [Haloferax mediterranei ATCC 33500]EMA05295.1 short-chain dehydrogenase/reductase SDR [Haloferax mediterranei ATCC 33500]MDX5989903.1 SDR family oxidoreductase [Haloferax mediterranei ATCC 33500]QCQ77344.1 SDR family oxidoreductase [Haloferax mediterranei ATCC 33500]
MDLTDTVAVVTGASSGIGEATAKALAREGCSVVLVARREDRLERIADEIESDRTLVIPTDVTDEDEVTAMVEETREVFGCLDILVNNAGVLRVDPVAEADMADFREQVEVNLLGAMNTTHAALPVMLESEHADIVTVSSVNARHPAKEGSAYTATKYGVNGFCRSLRKEMADEQVRVTIVMPGPVDSEMRDWENWEGRALEPTDVAESIAFAVSRPEHVEIPEITVSTTDKLR